MNPELGSGFFRARRGVVLLVGVCGHCLGDHCRDHVGAPQVVSVGLRHQNGDDYNQGHDDVVWADFHFPLPPVVVVVVVVVVVGVSRCR